jgi:peptidoglycan/LPS O-acetylase OafA/YrhL
MQQTSSRSIFLDFLKGIAIIAVILYHSGLCVYGYLGVDIFLVIGGYLITKSIVRQRERGQFNYFGYLLKRLLRLWPILIIISGLSLAIGWWLVLPDNLKNTAETAVGSVTFTNNVVQYITSGNYWDQSNDFKPLMHTWYVGLLMQFYVLFPLILFLNTKQIARSRRLSDNFVLWIIIIASLICYLSPQLSTASKFYLLPARLFELCLGSLIAVGGANVTKERKSQIGIAIILLLCFIKTDLTFAQIRLLLTVTVVSTMLIFYEKSEKTGSNKNIVVRIVAKLGMMSYSLYLWHQVILAFYRYCFRYQFTWIDYFVCIALSLVIGWVSYKFFEQGLMSVEKNHRFGKIAILAVSIVMVVILIPISAYAYRNLGVVRDIPELSIKKSMPISIQDYNQNVADRFNNDFPDNGKKNILVVGDSYGRDWINVLLESGRVDSMNISYYTDPDSTLWQRSLKADIVYVANNGDYTKYSDFIPLWLTKGFWRVGHKEFGKTMGPAYVSLRLGVNKRTRRILLSQDELALETRERHVFGSHYIDIMGSMSDGGYINLITPDGKLISHDGLHLTPAGAKYIASRIFSR